MPAPATFRAVGDRAAARLRKRAEWAAAATQRRAAHDLATNSGSRACWPRIGSPGPSTPRICTDVGVDSACGAQEPSVDEWEAGTRYPVFEQLLALAALTHQSPDSFVAREGDVDFDIRDTTMWCHQQSRAAALATLRSPKSLLRPSKNVPVPTTTAPPTCSEMPIASRRGVARFSKSTGR